MVGSIHGWDLHLRNRGGICSLRYADLKRPRMPTRFAPLFSQMLVRYLGRFALGPLVVRVKTEFLVFNSACFLFVDRAYFNAFISSPEHPPDLL